MSEEVGGLRRELAAATTVEEYRRIKEAKKVTAATTDLVAAALVALELYAQTNRWKLIMLTVKDAAGIDGRDAREMLRKLGARRSLAEVAAWSGDDLAGWFGHNEQYLARLQPMAREGGITIGALLDGVVADDMKAVLPDAADVKAKIAVRTKLRIAAREQLPTLVVPPRVLKVMEASLHADVAERPRDAAAMMGAGYGRTEFGKWCDSIRVGADQVRARARERGGFEARALFARRDPKPRAQAASEHTEDEVRDTLKPIAEILREAGEWERAARVTREWVGVSAAPDAPEAFCELLEASPVGIPCALEFTLDTKRHWFRRHKLDRRTVDRILLAIAAEEHRRAAVVRVSLRGRKIGGGVPAELVRLTNLEVVDLSSNELTGRSRSRMLRLRDGTESEISHTFPVPAMCRRDSRVDREPDEPQRSISGESRVRDSIPELVATLATELESEISHMFPVPRCAGAIPESARNCRMQ